jgi:hypothetical protein
VFYISETTEMLPFADRLSQINFPVPLGVYRAAIFELPYKKKTLQLKDETLASSQRNLFARIDPTRSAKCGAANHFPLSLSGILAAPPRCQYRSSGASSRLLILRRLSGNDIHKSSCFLQRSCSNSVPPKSRDLHMSVRTINKKG